MQREAYLEMYKNEDRHWWSVARRMVVQTVLDSYFPNKDTRRILEAGCGSGGNLELLAKYGNLYAIELNDEARHMANRRGICLVEKGSLPDNIPFTGGFDLVCILDVLEHIDDDFEALKSVRKLLSANGKLLITVPAYRFLWSAHDVILHHKRRYVKNQLNDLVQRSGFKILYSTYFNTLLFPIVAAIRVLKNALGKEGETDMKMPSHLLNIVLRKFFSTEKFLIPEISLPFGVSILLLAETSTTE